MNNHDSCLATDPKAEVTKTDSAGKKEEKEELKQVDNTIVTTNNKDHEVSGDKINNSESSDKKNDLTIVLPDPPLKSALKKPKNPSPPETDLEDDTSTVISASTITSAQLKRANVSTVLV